MYSLTRVQLLGQKVQETMEWKSEKTEEYLKEI